MQSKAKVVIIGGGVIGCSVAYHLAHKGWTDIVLCERDEISAGATTHAVGNVILYTLDPTISRLNQYSVGLYPKLEAETGMIPGFHQCGNMRIATHPDRLDEFRRYMDVAATTGVKARLLSVEEVAALYPLMKTEGLLGAVLNPDDGYVSPADLAQALAAGARQKGVKIQRGVEVTGLTQVGTGWRVKTTAGTIEAEHLVSATGNYSQRTGRMIGRNAQSVPVRHQYVITEPLVELAERRRARLPELPVFRDPEQSFYVRQEGDCLLMGAYDGRGDAMFIDDVPEGYGRDPLPDELDKLLPYLERAVGRLPRLETLGLHSIINSPMPYTPDDLPMTGPAYGVDNLWLAEGNPFGITLAGGIGWQLAEWMVEGEPSIDMWACDSRRFGEWAGRRWAARKVEEAYEHTYLLLKPGEELQAGRGLRTSPLHDLLAERGAVFGTAAGWEYPNWFAPEGMERKEVGSFDRPNWFEVVHGEARRPWREPVMVDTTAETRLRIHGAEAEEILRSVLATDLPGPGGVASSHLLTARGTVALSVTVVCEGPDVYALSCAIEAETYAADLLCGASAGRAMAVENLTGRVAGLMVFGQNSDEILSRLTQGASDTIADRHFDEICIAYCDGCLHRNPVHGLPGWRIEARVEHLRAMFLALEAAGVGLIGARALTALRIEHGVPVWQTELTADVTMAASGLSTDAGKKRLVHLRITPVKGTPLGREPIRNGEGQIVGSTTSGGWGHLSDAGYVLGYVLADADPADLEIQILNTWYRAEPVAAA